ncbi:hypothetical protein EJ08DRAFT_650760 [Tothia fuscella]|uniref:Uncharacterized protein n=1 Tax=Tothia fuscella TaxID=1048955 RepID=A0A9P4NNC4_9PEZI|nr:hypothetical protein EJ08DRAFT_650760 [Tothia fuscella]
MDSDLEPPAILRLPQEIRDEIYKYHFASYEPFFQIVGKNATYITPRNLIPERTEISPTQLTGYTKIFAVNRQMHDESMAFFYKYLYPKLYIIFTSLHQVHAFRDAHHAHPYSRTIHQGLAEGHFTINITNRRYYK